jgi:cold shock CspA family protein
MRTHGTLARWNDDRGFGFIATPQGTSELFVHISAFPRDGTRPRVGELISFEIEPGQDGRQRAVRVMRPGQGGGRRRVSGREQQRPARRGLSGSIALVAVVSLGLFAWSRLESIVQPPEAIGFSAPAELPASPSRFSCDGRTMCSQMKSCEEATYFIRNCPDTQMDGDNDGVPCESQWCN